MSSFLSAAYTPTEVSSSFNTNLAAKVLAIKENKYSENKAKVEAQQALYANQLKGLRDSDNEYIAARLQEANQAIESYGNKDYSLTANTDALLGNLKAVYEDPIVRSAVLNRAKYDQINKEIAEKRKKNDGSYSDVNYSYMLEQGGYNAYMRGETKDLGKLQYQNYIDVTKTALSKVKDFKDLRGDETIEIPFTDTDGTRRIRKETVKGLTDSEILAYMPQILSPDESKQLQINGWAKYQGENGLEVAQSTFQKYKNDVNSNLDSNISTYTTNSKNKNLSQEERDKAFKLKTAEEARKAQITENLNSIDINSAASIGGFLETQSWKTNFAEMAGAKTSIDYDTDAAAYQAANLELALRQDRRSEAKLPYEMAKLQADAAKATAAITQPSSTGISLSTIEPEKVDEAQPYESLMTDFNKQSNAIVASGVRVLEEGGVDDNTKKAYQDNYNDAIRKGYAPATATKMAFSRSGLSNLFPEEYSNILETYTRRGNIASVAKKADDTLVETFTENPDKYVQQAVNTLEWFKNKQWYPTVEERTAGLQKQKQISDFINNNGGIQGLTQKLSDPKNSNLISQFAKIIPNSTLAQDSEGKRNEVVAKTNQGIVNTGQIATVTDPKLAERIVNAIPQEQDRVPFNPKQGITYKSTPQGTFEIIQSGAKEGVKGIFGTSRTYEVKQGDDLYNLLNSLTLNEAQRREVTADKYTTAINNENIQYLDKPKATKAAGFVSNTLRGYQLTSQINPTRFLTEPTTNEAYKGKLKGIIPDEKVDELTKLMSTKSYEKFAVSATPVLGQWTVDVTLKKGDSPLLLGEVETGRKVMDKQLLLFVKQYPQIMVGEALLEYIQENPREIDTILNRLR